MSIDELWELHADVIFEFDQKKYCLKKSNSKNGCATFTRLIVRAALSGSGVLTLDRLSGLSGGARQLHGTKFATSTFLATFMD